MLKRLKYSTKTKIFNYVNTYEYGWKIIKEFLI